MAVHLTLSRRLVLSFFRIPLKNKVMEIIASDLDLMSLRA